MQGAGLAVRDVLQVGSVRGRGAGSNIYLLQHSKFHAAYFHAPLQHNVATSKGKEASGGGWMGDRRLIKPSVAIQVEKFKPT